MISKFILRTKWQLFKVFLRFTYTEEIIDLYQWSVNLINWYAGQKNKLVYDLSGIKYGAHLDQQNVMIIFF